MKKLLLLVSFITFFVVCTFAQTPKNITIMQLQQVSQDSLLKMDTLQNTAPAWLDDSKYYRVSKDDGDTISVTGVVMVKPRILSYTLQRYNTYIQDTTGKIWAALNVLTDDSSAQAQQTLINAIDTGWVVTFTGRVKEYTGGQSNSLTELFAYSPTYYTTATPLNYLYSTPKRPEPIEVNVSDFANGAIPPNGKVKFSTGEQYESMYVIIRNVTVSAIDWTSGSFYFVDAAGNTMQMYDGSAYYTLRSHKNSASKYQPPAVGTKLAYIRGLILPQPLNNYTIMPLYPGTDQLTGSNYPGDIKVDKYAPTISSITRNPIAVKPTDNVKVTATIKDNNPGGSIDSAFFNYQVGNSPLQTIKLNTGDTSYTIPAQSDGTPVKYFFAAYNHIGLKGISPDTSKSWGYYVVRAGGLTISDIQYTPFVDGNSPYIGGTVTINGIVTADSSDTPGGNLFFMQSGTGPWSGINLYGTGNALTLLRALKRGDSVAVTGAVSEYGKTELIPTSIKKIDSNKTLPAPSLISIKGVGSYSYSLSSPPLSGDRIFEPWEGVLVQIQNVYVTNMNADPPPGHYGEWFICSSPTSIYGLRVNDNGSYPYYFDTSSLYTVSWKKLNKSNLLPVGTFISSLTGIIDYTNSNYKLEPRKADDFVGIKTLVEKISSVPSDFSLSQNYPNPFNPSTIIEYSLPQTEKVTLKIYNILGQEVMTLVDQTQTAGRYKVNLNGSKLASGVYLYHLKTDDFSKTMKMILMK
jgi:DNA/RNA endonuclease YhcR with UshA esterase domain